MKIAILGANGFIGRNLFNHISQYHQTIPIVRTTLNLLDSVQVRHFLKQNYFDVVVNCAATMTDNHSVNDARNNLGMFMNFYDNRNLFGKFINTASGAEFDRELNIDCADENLIFDRMPKDSYGWGQNVKARLCVHTDGFYNIRIFNCFGQGEQSTRIFPRFLKDGYLEISNDRYFDYFSIQDLKKVVMHSIENDWVIKDINAVYDEKLKISEVISKFCLLNNLIPNFKILSTKYDNYTGNNKVLKSLDIKLYGLEKGLIDYIKKD